MTIYTPLCDTEAFTYRVVRTLMPRYPGPCPHLMETCYVARLYYTALNHLIVGHTERFVEEFIRF